MKLEIIGDLLAQLHEENPQLDLGGVFINEMPLGVKHGVLLMDTYAGTSIDPYIPRLRSSGMRLVVRSPRYMRGYRVAMMLTELLPLQTEQQLSGKFLRELLGEDIAILLKQVYPMIEPKPYRSSDGGFVEFEIDIELVYVVPQLLNRTDTP